MSDVTPRLLSCYFFIAIDGFSWPRESRLISFLILNSRHLSVWLPGRFRTTAEATVDFFFLHMISGEKEISQTHLQQSRLLVLQPRRLCNFSYYAPSADGSYRFFSASYAEPDGRALADARLWGARPGGQRRNNGPHCSHWPTSYYALLTLKSALFLPRNSH